MTHDQLLMEISNDIKALRSDFYQTQSIISAMERDLLHHIRRTEMLEVKTETLEKKVLMWAGGLAVAGWIAATGLALLKVVM